MKILFLSHRIPYPPNKGDKIRSFHFLQHLSKDHEVYLGAFIDDPEEKRFISELSRYCREVHVEVLGAEKYMRFIGHFLAGKPLSIAPFYSHRFSKWVQEVTEKYDPDLAFLFSSAMGQYLDRLTCPALLDLVDLDSNKWAQYAKSLYFPLSSLYRREGDKLRGYDEGLLQNDSVKKAIYVNAREMDLAKKAHYSTKLDFIENGVDIEPIFRSGTDLPAKSQKMIFVGLMDYLPNVEAVRRFALEIFPTIKRTIPGAEFDIVGMDPSRQVSELSRIEGVRVVGAVPDVTEYLRRSQLFVAPFNLTQGIPNKILEAMANELPVVTVPKVASLFDRSDRNGITSADTNKAFAEQCISMLGDEERRIRMAADAFEYVKRYCRWEDKLEKMDSILKELTGL